MQVAIDERNFHTPSSTTYREHVIANNSAIHLNWHLILSSSSTQHSLSAAVIRIRHIRVYVRISTPCLYSQLA